MTEGSLFAGIMGFGEGFRQAGFTSVWAVEKDLGNACTVSVCKWIGERILHYEQDRQKRTA